MMRIITTFEQVNQVLGEFILPHDPTQEYNLDRMLRLMGILGNPQESLKIIHVAGTSGKTSTAYYVASLLHAAGLKTGLTVSPHIDEVNERAQIDMVSLPEAEFCTEFSQFMEIVDSTNIKPIYFEVVIAFGLWLFHKRKVDYAIVEVGIGGLIDSTNIVKRADKICVITDIGLDHTEMLGDTIEKIALQKAGIIKPKNEVFMNLQPTEITNIVKKQCESVGAKLHITNRTIAMPNLPLFQGRNFSLAYDIVSDIFAKGGLNALSDQQTQQAANIVIPARMEVVKFQNKLLVLDGSHNEQKIEALVESMKNRFPDINVRLFVSFGFVDTKRSSILASMTLLSQLGQNIVVTDYTYSHNSAASDLKTKQLGDIAKQAGFKSVVVEPNPKLAFKIFMDNVDSVGLVTGSFYLQRPVREIVFKS